MPQDNIDTAYLKKLDKFNHGTGPGLALLVVENGDIVLKAAYGYADIENGTRITPQSNFRIASVSKQFTGMALAILEEASDLDVNQSILTYIPELPDNLKEITVYHLIHHMSGVPDYIHLCSFDKNENILSNLDIINFLKTNNELEFTPGNAHAYSNTGYNLLGTVIERASSVSFCEFVENKILKPAGMKHSSVAISPDQNISNQVHGYSAWPFLERYAYNTCDYVHGEDGILTSLEDMTMWIKALEQDKLVSNTMKKKIFSPAKTSDGSVVKYGYGWGIDDFYGHDMHFHAGAWIGFNSVIISLPDHKLWYVAFSNCSGVDTWDIISPLIKFRLGISSDYL